MPISREHAPGTLQHQPAAWPPPGPDTRCFNTRFRMADIFRGGRHVSKVLQPDSSTRQVRTFRDLFLITELLDSKAESDDVGF
jgi:hypothetical protein